jgi:hypothetical protein
VQGRLDSLGWWFKGCAGCAGQAIFSCQECGAHVLQACLLPEPCGVGSRVLNTLALFLNGVQGVQTLLAPFLEYVVMVYVFSMLAGH